MPAYLDSILAAHRAAASADTRDPAAVMEEAKEWARTEGVAGRRGFVDALVAGRAARGMAVISEIKRRSPSKGDLDPGLDPASVAVDYQAGGASCLSVLTDEEFFGGSRDDLVAARSACSLPVLRKDFTVSALDVCDAAAMGADAVLLIVAALDDGELYDFLGLARDLRLAGLVEVHDEAELDRALAVGADLVGVNQRDLRTFEVDRERALRMGERMPDGVVAVAESGIRDAADVERLASAGYTAVLVGEALVRSADRTSAVDGLLGARA
ncbi:MAG: indole-3-glycerol phosphate synthase TrpC [Acidimicrobiales bacterium]|jgi:indole-3-glycerol phosphate synthase